MGPPGVAFIQHSNTKTVNGHTEDCKSNIIIITMWCEYNLEEVLGLTLFLCLIGDLLVSSLLNFQTRKYYQGFKMFFLKKWWLCLALGLWFCTMMHFIYQISNKQSWLHWSLGSKKWLVLE